MVLELERLGICHKEQQKYLEFGPGKTVLVGLIQQTSIAAL